MLPVDLKIKNKKKKERRRKEKGFGRRKAQEPESTTRPENLKKGASISAAKRSPHVNDIDATPLQRRKKGKK